MCHRQLLKLRSLPRRSEVASKGDTAPLPRSAAQLLGIYRAKTAFKTVYWAYSACRLIGFRPKVSDLVYN